MGLLIFGAPQDQQVLIKYVLVKVDIRGTATTFTRLLAPNFLRIDETWDLTVVSEILSS